MRYKIGCYVDKYFVKCLFFRKKVVSLHHEKGVKMRGSGDSLICSPKLRIEKRKSVTASVSLCLGAQCDSQNSAKCVMYIV